MQNNNNDFICPKLQIRNLDTFTIRKSIFNALQKHMHGFKGRLLDVGCGKLPYKQYILENSKVSDYIGLDIEGALDYGGDRPDFTWDGNHMPFDDNSFDSVFSTEVFEHIPELSITLMEIYRVLKPNGTMFFTIPFIWPLHEVPHDEYRYTPFSLNRKLKETGFSTIEILATGGWNAGLAQMLGLWVKRSSLNRISRRILEILLKPFIGFLLKTDTVPTIFKESTMITGCCGIVKK